MTFAPSLPEFLQRARLAQDAISATQRPRLEAPQYISQRGQSPWELKQADARRRYAGREVLHRDVGYDQFRSMSMKRTIPTGAQWCPVLATVFGPPVDHNPETGEVL